jgi:hypothetical protein
VGASTQGGLMELLWIVRRHSTPTEPGGEIPVVPTTLYRPASCGAARLKSKPIRLES